MLLAFGHGRPRFSLPAGMSHARASRAVRRGRSLVLRAPPSSSSGRTATRGTRPASAGARYGALIAKAPEPKMHHIDESGFEVRAASRRAKGFTALGRFVGEPLKSPGQVPSSQ